VGDIAREIVEEHLDLCLDAGINHEGINAEVAKGQWEFQIFGKGSKNAADQMWVARYLLMRLCEKYGVDVNFHCKPLGKDVDWNGSGMHSNFSTTHLREVGGKEYFEALMAAFDKYKNEHIAVYGPDNHLRLTGLHETQSIDKFNYGVANRGASIRVPHSFVNNGYKGYLEDRRPNSQAIRTRSRAASCRRSRRSRRSNASSRCRFHGPLCFTAQGPFCSSESWPPGVPRLSGLEALGVIAGAGFVPRVDRGTSGKSCVLRVATLSPRS
jgi:hypothetical protein